MNRYMFLAIAAIFGPLLTAEACDRCGLFGNKCRFQSHHVVQQVAAYTPPAVNQTQNFVFQNSFPVPSLTQQGSSVYGYSLAAAPYTFDSAAYLDRAARFQELALETAQQGINGFNANAQAATALADSVDRRTKNAMVALAAINANQQQPSAASANNVQTFTMRATVRNGQLTIENGPPAEAPSTQPVTAVPGGVQAFGANVLTACARCHDGNGTGGTPTTFRLDGTQEITPELHDRSLALIKSGKMPPPGKSQPLSESQRIDLGAALGSLKKRIIPE